MHWGYDESNCESQSGTPKSTSQTKRRCLEYYDSGLGKDSEISLYEQPHLGDHDVNSRDSGCDEEDGFLAVTTQKQSWLDNEESIDFTNVDINVSAKPPSDFESLLSGPCVGLKESSDLMEIEQLVSLDTERDKAIKVSFSRIESVDELVLSKSKRCKGNNSSPALQRSLSYNEENIKYALQRSQNEPNLIGDFSKPCHLPLTSGRHQDLKCIIPTTLASLVNGEYDETVTSYKIIDCRFPYEFEGGHIRGAINLYTKQLVANMLDNCELLGYVLVFHCEFSSERGPSLYRFLRKLDRNRNEYPKLSYPEIYLLEGGYKKFFEEHAYLCEPRSYKPMLHPQHQADLRFFKAKAKFSNEDRSHPGSKGSSKRLGFL